MFLSKNKRLINKAALSALTAALLLCACAEKSESSGAYEAVVQKSVATMEHDEQNGMTPRQLAEAVFHLATKKHPKPLSTCGTQYKVFAVLQKALPQS